jgi:hypothetical protein
MRRAQLNCLLTSVAALAILSASGCRRDWVKPEEIPGTWTMNQTSRRLLSPETRNAAATFVFEANGNFSVTEVPEDLLYPPSNIGPKLISGAGTWKLIYPNDQQLFDLSFKTMSLGLRGTLPYDTMILNVERQNSVVTLYYFQDDPDLGRRFVFEKKAQ